MRKAYDTFLQCEVSADLAVKGGSFESYRYECAHCGEEVRLAAVNSGSMATHFRHRSGNGDVECEFYLGQYVTFSTDVRSRKSKNERVEFYFDINTKIFYIGIKFSEADISEYEQHSATLELRESALTEAFYSLRISRSHFDPDSQRLIPLDKFSYSYCVSNTLESVTRKYEVFRNSASKAPSFFKVQVGDGDNRSKLVRSSTLYTHISYFMIYNVQNRYCDPMSDRLPSEITVHSSVEFETMGRLFCGKVVYINSKTSQINSLLSSWGYQLEASETLTLLWPPSTLLDDTLLIGSDSAYLYSSFELQAHGNINLYSGDIKKIADGLSRVAVQSRTKVYKKNAELILEKCEQASDGFAVILVNRKMSRICVVKDDDSTYLFNHSGVSPLCKGTPVYLTPKSQVRQYTSGYLNETVAPPEQMNLTGQGLLQDLLMYYKRREAFRWEDYESIDLSHTAFQYIEACERFGLINSAAKQLIEEGKI